MVRRPRRRLRPITIGQEREKNIVRISVAAVERAIAVCLPELFLQAERGTTVETRAETTAMRRSLLLQEEEVELPKRRRPQHLRIVPEEVEAMEEAAVAVVVVPMLRRRRFDGSSLS